MIHKYGYSSPTDGTYTIDGKVYDTGIDFRTEQRYREYLEVGLDTLLLQGNDPYCGEDFETSQLRKNMSNAYAAGIRRIIVHDKRLYDLSATRGGLVGEGKQFATQYELNEFVRFCMRDYCKQDGFVGVMFVDEPSYEQFEAIGQLTDAVATVNDKIVCQCNLLPLNFNCESRYCAEHDGKSKEQCYREYVTEFCKRVLIRNIAMDSYPIRQEHDVGKFIASCHFAGLQIFSDVLRDYGRDKTLVLQSTAMDVCGKQKFRALNGKTLAYQYNLALCLGAHDVAYFTYWHKQVSRSDWESFPDGTSFVSQDGTKTQLYYAAQQMHADSAIVEKLIDGYRYADMTICGNADYVANVERRIFTECDVCCDGLYALTKLVDNQGNVIISAVSICDPDVDDRPKTIELNFGATVPTKVVVNNAERQSSGNIVTATLRGGECVLVQLTNCRK